MGAPRFRVSEHVEQAAFITWWDWNAKRWEIDRRLLFAVPNGGLRSAATAGRLKAEGVRPGVPDLVLAVARSTAHGLLIEMKAKNGAATPDQCAMAQLLREQGFRCVLAVTCRQAEQAIYDYLGAPPR